MTILDASSIISPRDLGGYEIWPNNCESSEKDYTSSIISNSGRNPSYIVHILSIPPDHIIHYC
jgi:hypothetical protein